MVSPKVRHITIVRYNLKNIYLLLILLIINIWNILFCFNKTNPWLKKIQLALVWAFFCVY